MLKGYRKINKYLTDWCHTNGFRVKCRLGTDFQYDPETKTIYYALAVIDKHDKLFIKLCKKYMPNVKKCDNFILSFFHELGHYMTDKNYTEEDWDAYDTFLREEFIEDKLTDKDYLKYYNYPIELDATKWGCNFININVDLIEEFNKNLTPLILEFYTKNKVEL